jgi:glycine cleavage system aminomethyltransferase T
LQGLLTNDIQALRAGQGCYSAYLTPQGRMIADMYVYELGDVMLLTTIRDVKDAVLFKLDQFVFAEDVQLGDVTGVVRAVRDRRPAGGHVVASLSAAYRNPRSRRCPEHGNARVDWRGSAAIVTRTTDAGEAGYDVYVETARADELKAAIADAGCAAARLRTRGSDRIEAGVPVFHRDMDEETIPLEAGIESRRSASPRLLRRAGSDRARAAPGHGRVARKLVGLRVDGDRVPAFGGRASRRMTTGT